MAFRAVIMGLGAIILHSFGGLWFKLQLAASYVLGANCRIKDRFRLVPQGGAEFRQVSESRAHRIMQRLCMDCVRLRYGQIGIGLHVGTFHEVLNLTPRPTQILNHKLHTSKPQTLGPNLQILDPNPKP